MHVFLQNNKLNTSFPVISNWKLTRIKVNYVDGQCLCYMILSNCENVYYWGIYYTHRKTWQTILKNGYQHYARKYYLLNLLPHACQEDALLTENTRLVRHYHLYVVCIYSPSLNPFNLVNLWLFISLSTHESWQSTVPGKTLPTCW